ncbi:glycosyltransferase family 9 protein [Pseudonocardia broussonetiae]|uniref:Glycosyltransferase family 9 protein n=1 Tax=Pseudonocardia broussonetiae TaxID=2736640 RepID=A0A6M6JKZ9_9PSEU|nr:glycosyltransferase family 9 protein [Pseudonocardia broussonetiae]QJY48824.1 glycosyltransferase family 9 protein [Pseudonocardia broussonetiae]
MRRVLVVRLDGAGDVLLAGPAVRAVARDAHATMLCGPAGAEAARLLPGVRDVLVFAAPWVLADPPPVTTSDTAALIGTLAAHRFDAAVVLTSFHQSPLPIALVLRLAGVPFVGGASVDHAGALLDVRLRPGEDLDEDLPEPERALAIAAASGFPADPADDGLLAVRTTSPPAVLRLAAGWTGPPYVVVHPGAAVGARRWPAGHHAEAVRLLAAAGWRVVVTGGPGERDLTAQVAGNDALDLGGRTDLAGLAGVLAGAEALVVGNTGAAHLAAAVGTPVVSLFAPVVPAVRWRPYGVPHVLLGDQRAACRDSRARDCPVAGHPCLAGVTPAEVVAAVERLTTRHPDPHRFVPADEGGIPA